ncbi:30S ribosomal protein S18 [Patescibacteria group bacterium]|nr:30S ribosomal protein S18 [Patescibacteria group bacterium]
MNRNKKSNVKTKRNCYFCTNNVKEIDYKDTATLKRCISSYGKIVPRKRSSVCTKHQRKLSQAIKRARIMGLLPFLVQ